MKRSAVILVLTAVLAALTACSGGGDPKDQPPSTSQTPDSVIEFAQVYAMFETDLAAAKVLAEERGLKNAITSVRAVRAAYFDLDAAARGIDMPLSIADDVNAMLGAIGDLIAALDKQGVTTTSDDFEAADVASGAALKQADAAIQVVVDGLGAGSDGNASTNGTTKQRRVTAEYASGSTISDANAWVLDLLEIGAKNVNHLTPAEDMGVVVAWRAAFPEVLTASGVVGRTKKAPKNGISGFAVLTKDDAKPADSGNAYYLAFAVRDDSGACAGGVLSGYPDPAKGLKVDLTSGKPCSGEAVAAAAGY